MEDRLRRYESLGAIAIVVLLILGIGAVLLTSRAPAPIVINPPLPTSTPAPIEIYVSGAVAQPGVYTLAPGSNVQDALQVAGGSSGAADLNRVNLAKPLQNGEQVHVPEIGEAPPIAVSTDGEAPAAGGPININTASQADLETLPGIGPSLAGRIIEYRDANGPFTTVEDIQNVSGIGPAVFADIQDLITIGP